MKVVLYWPWTIFDRLQIDATLGGKWEPASRIRNPCAFAIEEDREMLEANKIKANLWFMAMICLLATSTSARAEWGWSPAVQSFFPVSPDSEAVVNPDVVLDEDEKATAIWTFGSPEKCEVRIATYSDGLWQKSQTISDACSGNVAKIVSSGQGRLTAIWEVKNESGYFLQSRQYSEGQWGQLSTITGYSKEPFTLDASSNRKGVVALIWSRLDVDSGNAAIESSQYNGDGWKAPYMLNSPAGSAGKYPAIAIDESNTSSAVWVEGELVKAARGYGSSWSPVSTIGKTYRGDRAYPEVVTTNNGRVIAVWCGPDIQGAAYYDGLWSPSELIATLSNNNMVLGYCGRLAIDGRGIVTVTWEDSYYDSSGSGIRIYLAQYSKNAWSSPITVANLLPTSSYQTYDPNLIADYLGNIVVFWVNKEYIAGCSELSSQYGSPKSCHPVPVLVKTRLESRRLSVDGWGEYIVISDAGNSNYAISSNLAGSTIIVWPKMGLVNSRLGTDPPLQPKMYPVAIEAIGNGVITSEPSGLDCGTTCTSNFYEGSIVSLLASKQCLSSWEGDCSGLECRLSIDSAKAVKGVFKLSTNLVVNNIGQGSVMTIPNGRNCGNGYSNTFDVGTKVLLSATPNSGWGFSGWSGDCDGFIDCSLVMDADKSVTATFISSKLTVTRTGSGTITSTPYGINCGSLCSANFIPKTSVYLSAVADTGYTFSGWAGDCKGTSDCVLAMDKDRNVIASFIALPLYKLHVSRKSNGAVESSPAGIICGMSFGQCDAKYCQDTIVTLKATPKRGYFLKSWRNCQEPSGDFCRVKMNVAKQTIDAVFAHLPKYKLNINKSKYGSVTITPEGLMPIKKCGPNSLQCNAKITAGVRVYIEINPLPGRSYQWSGACAKETSTTCWVTMDADKSVGVSFP